MNGTEEMYERWFNLLNKIDSEMKELRSEISDAYLEFKHNQQQSDKE